MSLVKMEGERIRVALRFEQRGDTIGVVYQEGYSEWDILTAYRPAIEEDPKLFQDLKELADAWFYRKTRITPPVKALKGGALVVPWEKI